MFVKVKPYADWLRKKKRSNQWQKHSFVCFWGEFMALESAFGFILPLVDTVWPGFSHMGVRIREVTCGLQNIIGLRITAQAGIWTYKAEP